LKIISSAPGQHNQFVFISMVFFLQLPLQANLEHHFNFCFFFEVFNLCWRAKMHRNAWIIP